MKQERAKRIMAVLGWGLAETARQYNRVSGARYDRHVVNKQVNGERGVSDGLAVFLKLSLRLAHLERRIARLRALGPGSG